MQQARANQELHWDAGTAQVDFGEADFDVIRYNIFRKLNKDMNLVIC